MSALIRDLEGAKFDAYLTSVGGSGLGILSPYNNSPDPAESSGEPLTPPETPAKNDADGGGGGGDGLEAKDMREQFCEVTTDELSQWANARGRWLFV